MRVDSIKLMLQEWSKKLATAAASGNAFVAAATVCNILLKRAATFAGNPKASKRAASKSP